MSTSEPNRLRPLHRPLIFQVLPILHRPTSPNLGARTGNLNLQHTRRLYTYSSTAKISVHCGISLTDITGLIGWVGLHTDSKSQTYWADTRTSTSCSRGQTGWCRWKKCAVVFHKVWIAGTESDTPAQSLHVLVIEALRVCATRVHVSVWCRARGAPR